ncbi:hypothetical protein [Carnimonas bestiolae]|uniref:hypothetical protein n=1 Tax=Carnimonas bestiolae TaxID=3402172 RepID=UPI003F4AB94F
MEVQPTYPPNKRNFMYLLSVSATPLPDTKFNPGIPGASVEIWVNTSDKDEAVLKARELISSRQWFPESIDAAGEILPEQFPYLDKSASLLCEQAQQEGVSSLWIGWLAGEKGEATLH